MSTEIRLTDFRPEVLQFAYEMECQLKRNDSRGGWKEMTHAELVERLEMNLHDLKVSRMNKEWPYYKRTCADIANFALMLSDNAPKEKP